MVGLWMCGYGRGGVVKGLGLGFSRLRRGEMPKKYIDDRYANCEETDRRKQGKRKTK